MPIYHSSTTPVAESRKKLIKWRYDGTPNLSGEFDLDLSVSNPSADGNISAAAIETIELVSNATSPVTAVTRTLPTLASADGCIVTVTKVDSGAGAVIIQGNGSPAESIISTSGTSTTYSLVNVGQSVRLIARSALSAWVVIGNN
jgi:hypothetical protein